MIDGRLVFGAAVEQGRLRAQRWRGQTPAFCCVLAHTDTCLIDGLSAAGVAAALRPMTPAADAEVVHLGQPRCLPRLPSNPLGAPGPAGITRAALGLLGVRAEFVGVGLRVWPATAYQRLSLVPGASIETGQAVPAARELFAAGRTLGHGLAGQAPYLVLGESVPGGTTTALALLLALGMAAEGRVSGSQPGNAHALKTRVVRAGLAAAGLRPGDGCSDPLGAVEAVGDPMQPVVAGIAAGVADTGGEVLLAGGSQMLAVAALLTALEGCSVLDAVAIGTTRWVLADPAADVAGLATEIGPRLPIIAANLDFSISRHPALRLYERGLVKEGVGAGGACVAALLATGTPAATLQAAIDDAYDGLLDAPSRTLQAAADDPTHRRRR